MFIYLSPPHTQTHARDTYKIANTREKQIHCTLVYFSPSHVPTSCITNPSLSVAAESTPSRLRSQIVFTPAYPHNHQTQVTRRVPIAFFTEVATTVFTKIVANKF